MDDSDYDSEDKSAEEFFGEDKSELDSDEVYTPPSPQKRQWKKPTKLKFEARVRQAKRQWKADYNKAKTNKYPLLSVSYFKNKYGFSMVASKRAFTLQFECTPIQYDFNALRKKKE
eukprot:UN08448